MMKPFFENKIDQKSTGKNTASLIKSQKIRSDFIARYGYIPDSILKHDKKDTSKIAQSLGRRYEDTAKAKKIFRVSGQGSRSGALSTFPQKIGHLIVNFYCPKDGIVYDPFAGHNSRMELTFKADRHYTGVDLSKIFMKSNRQIKDKLIEQQGYFKSNKKIKLIEGSSDKVDLSDNYGDFTITSPPYWDIEYYGDEPKQLGKNKTYQEFLDAISKNIKENFRILKPGAFCAWFMNDFVKNKIFYPYHSDLIPIFINAGFEIYQIYIIDLGVPIGIAFIQDIINHKRFPKRHEYCLLFKKPK